MVEDPYKNLKITKGAVAKPSTTLVNKTGSWRAFRPVIDHDKCIGCGTCEKFCPDMSVKEVEDGKFEIDLDYCKGCGICAVECPVDAIQMVKEEK
ncbi:pyruvate synthase [candidate division MSBL1 archaeon SCGC-AAA261G05]|uniref:Ferredoxin n=3 Tax=candidate division MSBL1 TaxID=215777 RepID=A0A133UZA3_9EURY|nr:pyruvate synthase [candidate division MSBL1 archaeon SCGC-AAA261C02]KXB02788.1 pyruvate synthase [candidate division MSBL1 archaeon SCGC-AAA261G05]KXB04286.1 pyruvate synthase [candidate division MSBL1 archaeon SCGC-AAA261O19]